VITIAMATAVLLLAHAQRDDRVAPATVPPRPHVVATGDRILGAAGPPGATAAGARSHPINVYATTARTC
jgi:hypothetical protein